MDTDVELLGAGEAATASPGSLRTLIGWLVAGAAAVGLMLVAPHRGIDVVPGQLLQPVGPYLGDPFAREWVALDGAASGPSGYRRPLPMVSSDPPCVGFGRLDWPVADRQPTVARCFDPQTADQLPKNGVSVLHRISAGRDTWLIFMFGQEISEVELRVAGPVEAVFAPDRVYVGGRFAAILVPVDSRLASLAWTTRGGHRYELLGDGELSDNGHDFLSWVQTDEL